MCEDVSKPDYFELMKKHPLMMKKYPFSVPPKSLLRDRSGHSADGEGDEHKFKKGRRKSGSKKHRAGKNQKRKYKPYHKQHRAGKNQKRKYKPYHKLTTAEQEKVDERISRRSSLKRAFLHSCGVPLAPLNTTQFLVNDSIEANSLLKEWEDRDDSADASSTSEYDEISLEFDEPQHRWGPDDFQEIWSHRFEPLSQTDLAEWYFSLEEEVRQMQEDIEVGLKEELEVEQKILVFEGEVRRYECEVAALKKLNEKLIKMVKDLPCKDELAKILKEFPVFGEKCLHLEEDDSPFKDELPKIPKDFHVEEEKVIDVKDLHIEEDNSPCEDELPKIVKEFPVYGEKHQHLEEDNSPCKDELIKMFKDLPVSDENDAESCI